MSAFLLTQKPGMYARWTQRADDKAAVLDDSTAVGTQWQMIPPLDAAFHVGHTAGMTSTEKIAVSLPRGLAERARRAVRQGRASSVSAYVAAALEEKSNHDDLAALLDEMLAETGGPLTAGERQTADRALGVRSKRARKR